MGELEPQVPSQIEESPVDKQDNLVNFNEILSGSQDANEDDSSIDSPSEVEDSLETTVEAGAPLHRTAEQRIAGFLNKLAGKIEESGDKRIERQDKVKQVIRSIGRSALSVMKNIGYTTVGLGIMAADKVKDAGYTAVGLGVMGIEKAKDVAQTTAEKAKEGAQDAGLMAIGLGAMGVEAIGQGAKNVAEKVKSNYSAAMERKIERVKQRAEIADQKQAVKKQEAIEARQAKDQKAAEKQKAFDAAVELYVQKAQEARQNKANRKAALRDLMNDRANSTKSTIGKANEIGRTILQSKKQTETVA